MKKNTERFEAPQQKAALAATLKANFMEPPNRPEASGRPMDVGLPYVASALPAGFIEEPNAAIAASIEEQEAPTCTNS
ncbi:hypothetical protein O9992_00530 [Vibrio lentus]|nr:hypothetical protein [Vibrio lentus]